MSTALWIVLVVVVLVLLALAVVALRHRLDQRRQQHRVNRRSTK